MSVLVDIEHNNHATGEHCSPVACLSFFYRVSKNRSSYVKNPHQWGIYHESLAEKREKGPLTMRNLINRLVSRPPTDKPDKEICLWMNTGLRPIEYNQYWVSRSSDSRSYTFSVIDEPSVTISNLFRHLDTAAWQLAIAHHLEVHGSGSQRSCYCARCLCWQQTPDNHEYSLVLANQLLPFDTIGIIRKTRHYDFIHAICATKAILPKKEYVTSFVALQGICAKPSKLDAITKKYGLNQKDMFVAVNTSGHTIKTIIDTFHLRVCEKSSVHRPQ